MCPTQVPAQDRPPWAPTWATEADLALLTEPDPYCYVCARTAKLTRWLKYGVIACSRHSPVDVDETTQEETEDQCQ